MKTYTFELTYATPHGPRAEQPTFTARDQRSAWSKVGRYAHNGIPAAWKLSAMTLLEEAR